MEIITFVITKTALIDVFCAMEHPRLDQLYVEAHRSDELVAEAQISKALDGDAIQFCKWFGLSTLVWVPELVVGFINNLK